LLLRTGALDIEQAARVRNIKSPLALAKQGKGQGKVRGRTSNHAGRSHGTSPKYVVAPAAPPLPPSSVAAPQDDQLPKDVTTPAAPAAAAPTGASAAESDLQEKLKFSDLKVRSLEFKVRT
jgi:hypothetical protein